MNSPHHRPVSSGLKRLVFIVVTLNCLSGLKQITQSFFVPAIYQKDFLSPYLMAKAIINGVNPYLPLPELANRWIEDANSYSMLKHPTPHTPVLGLLTLPLGFLSYEAASIVWVVIELACLLSTIILLLHQWGKPITPQRVLVPFGLGLGWLPLQEDLWLGQLNTCLLLLLVCSCVALRKGKDITAGALLGGILSLKLIAWPIIIFLAFRQRWRAVLSAGIVIAIFHVLAIGILGVACIKDYYFKVAPFVAALHRPQDCNISSWTIGQRLFGGIGYYSLAPPLWSSSLLASVITYSVPLIVLIIGLVFTLRSPHFDSAFWGLVIISILVSPIAWTHYLILVAVPLGMLAQHFWQIRDNRKLIFLIACIAVPISIVGGMYQALSHVLTAQISPQGIGIIFSTRILPFIPSLALIGLFWMLWRRDYTILPNKP